MRVAIYTLGCKVNQYETQAMEQELQRRGHTLVDFESPADAYIINTCSVTAVSDKKSRQMIRRAKSRNPQAVVAACGCYVQTHTPEAQELGIDLIGGTGDRMEFLTLLEQAAEDHRSRVAVDEALRRRTFEVLPAGGMAARTRAMLKVEDGCVNFCSYCIIPYARGPVRSLPLERAVAAVCYRADFSVAELLYAVAAGVILLWMGDTVRRLITEKGRRGRIVYRFVLTVVCTVLTVYAGFSLLWGVNYYAESFQKQSGVYARESTPEELARVTEYFARQLAGCADQVQRDENGLFAESRDDIFADSVRVFDGVYDAFPCLVMEDHVPKGVRFSTALSAMDFTGFYFPFTGEANLNIDSPACYLPSTIAHEMAHQRGIASEQECNFIAIAASTTAQSPAYRYSGWLMGFTYLSNALYRADQEAWKQVRVLLPDTVVADLRDNSAYWAEFEGPVNDAAQKVYDSFLKSSGESRGTQSYGTVVDMLMAYYG